MHLKWKAMAMRANLGGMLAAGGLLACAMACVGQTAPANPAPCTVAPQPVPCGTATAPAKPKAGDQFPFPGEDGAATPAANTDKAAPQAPDAPAADAGSAAKKAGKDFPFPGEDTRPGSAPTPGESSSSSSSNDDPAAPDASPDAAGLKDKGSEGSTAPSGRHLLHRVNPIGTKLQTPEEREAEDLDVAHFYTQTGDLKGAYLRGQDAVKTAPDDPDAHFALAEIAQKLNKRDEAIAEYNACLKHDPDPRQAKAARKELGRLQP